MNIEYNRIELLIFCRFQGFTTNQNDEREDSWVNFNLSLNDVTQYRFIQPAAANAANEIRAPVAPAPNPIGIASTSNAASFGEFWSVNAQPANNKR